MSEIFHPSCNSFWSQDSLASRFRKSKLGDMIGMRSPSQEDHSCEHLTDYTSRILCLLESIQPLANSARHCYQVLRYLTVIFKADMLSSLAIGISPVPIETSHGLSMLQLQIA